MACLFVFVFLLLLFFLPSSPVCCSLLSRSSDDDDDDDEIDGCFLLAEQLQAGLCSSLLLRLDTPDWAGWRRRLLREDFGLMAVTSEPSFLFMSIHSWDFFLRFDKTRSENHGRQQPPSKW